MLYTFTKQLTGSPPYAETYAGLGASNVGASKGQSISTPLAEAPYVEVHNQGDRRLYADDITATGFNIKADPIGTGPPYTVSISVSTSAESVGVSVQLLLIRNQVQATYFKMPQTGNVVNLLSDEGKLKMPATMIDTQAANACNEFNMDVFGLPERIVGTIFAGDDYITMPSDAFLIKDIWTTVNGVHLIRQGGYAGLVREGIGLEGEPSKYALWSDDDQKRIYFDSAPTSDTSVTIDYWKLPASGEVADIFVDACTELTRVKCANLLRDWEAASQYSQMYIANAARFKSIQSKMNADFTTTVRNHLL